MRPKTTDHHKSFKIRDARRWLEEGKKVKVRIRFRGRERDYPEMRSGRLEGDRRPSWKMSRDVEQSPFL